MQSPGTISTQLKEIVVRGLQIKGQGEATPWVVHDTHGNLRRTKAHAFYDPGGKIIKVRLQSTLCLLQMNKQGWNHCHWIKLIHLEQFIKQPKSRISTNDPFQSSKHLAPLDAFNDQDPFKAADALVLAGFTRPITTSVQLHYHLGHIDFKEIQLLFRNGVLAKPNWGSLWQLHSAAHKLSNLPKCTECQYGQQHCHPAIPSLTSSNIIRDRTNILKADNVIPRHRILVHHFFAVVRVEDSWSQLEGPSWTKECYWRLNPCWPCLPICSRQTPS